MKLCSPAEVYRCLEGTYCIHLQGRVVSQAESRANNVRKPWFRNRPEKQLGKIDCSKKKSK
jgi:hypothetical protein